MEVFIIIALILAGVLLFIVEVFLIPGISIAGIASAICLLYANYYAFDTLGPIAGFITLIASVLSCIAIIIWFMHSKTMDKLSLKKTLDYKIDPLKGTNIRMMATGATAEVVEVGYFGAGQFIPCEELSAGMVGYIMASIKNVKDTRVGDTVTDNDRPCSEPLPGYKKVQSMVYCGLYPADGSKYPDLRDALEKLQLNDASLFYEPETSVALGFGFRCGFLGLIHLEIIQERLEREYNLDLVTTAPGVIY